MTWFKNRESAAYELLPSLEKFRDKNPMILGIPRGAIPMAKIIADGLGAELSVVLIHKIPHPIDEEFAIGSVGISGKIQLQSYAHQFHIPESYIQSAAEEQIKILRKRLHKYGLPPLNLKGRTVIIVDDGIATGATVIAAIEEVRALGAGFIVVATPVSSIGAAEQIENLVDEFISISIPEGFYAVGQFYSYFPQVSDEEVVGLLQAEHRAGP